MSYYFNNLEVQNVKNYETDYDGKVIHLTNLKDSTYHLTISLSDGYKGATLTDRKRQQIIQFDANFKFKTVNDIKNLYNSRLYTVVKFDKPRKFKHFVEDFEYAFDSVSKVVTVHLTQYKNEKRRKVINEHFYLFGAAPRCESYNEKSAKNYISKKYKVNFAPNYNLKKVLCLRNGEISSDISFEEIKKIDFTYTFPIDDVFPKKNTNY